MRRRADIPQSPRWAFWRPKEHSFHAFQTDLSPSSNVTVNLQAGNSTVTAGETPEARGSIVVRSYSKKRARRIADELQSDVHADKSGTDDVTITAGSARKARVDVAITTPHDTGKVGDRIGLEITTQRGDIRINSHLLDQNPTVVASQLTLRAPDGAIHTDDTDGIIDASAKKGIGINRHKGSINAETIDTPIYLKEIQGPDGTPAPTVRAISESGRIGGYAINASLTDIQTSSGRQSFAWVHSNDALFSTTTGSISVEEFEGSAKAHNTSGRTVFVKPTFTGETTFTTEDGRVSIIDPVVPITALKQATRSFRGIPLDMTSEEGFRRIEFHSGLKMLNTITITPTASW